MNETCPGCGYGVSTADGYCLDCPPRDIDFDNDEVIDCAFGGLCDLEDCVEAGYCTEDGSL